MADDLLDQIISIPAYGGGDAARKVFHLACGDGSAVAGGGGFPGAFFPPGLSPRPEAPAAKAGRDPVQVHPIRPNPSQLCRVRVVEKMRVLQELVPGSHKVLSMSRLGVAVAVAQGKVGEGGGKKPAWRKCSNNIMEVRAAKLMEDAGAAMQLLRSEALCIITISLAARIYQSHHQDEIPAARPEPSAPS